MAEHDLTPRIAPNLDRHLVFPLMEFLQERQLYPDEQILKSKIELLNKTNMVDYAMDIHKSLYHTEDVPQGNISIFYRRLKNICMQIGFDWVDGMCLIRYGGDEGGGGGSPQGSGGVGGAACQLLAEQRCRSGVEGWQAVQSPDAHWTLPGFPQFFLFLLIVFEPIVFEPWRSRSSRFFKTILAKNLSGVGIVLLVDKHCNAV